LQKPYAIVNLVHLHVLAKTSFHLLLINQNFLSSFCLGLERTARRFMKRPTQVDVAQLAGVSRATVSFVINDPTDSRVPISEETRQRVLKAVDELGYIPDTRAQALRSGDSKTIGLIIPDIHNPHFWQIVEGIEEEARSAGFHILFSSMQLNVKYGVSIFKDLAGRRIDGLILMGGLLDKSDEAKTTLAQLLKRHLPIVEMSDRPSQDHDIDCVYSDYREVTMEAMRHLFSLQHTRIGFINGAEPPELAVDRYEAYQASLESASIPFDPDLVVYCGSTLEDGYQAALQMLNRVARPSAILAINDLMSMGVLRAAGDLGMNVPKDLSLVSFDDIPVSRYLVPRLTTASKEPVLMGSEAVRLVFKRIQNPNQPRQEVKNPTRLIIRESTGYAPASRSFG
jgi:LacI family transcriptional regulator